MSKKIWLIVIAGAMLAGCGNDSTSGDTSGQCGNGVVEQGEFCDDGNENGGDGCSADCSAVESGFTCPEAGVACTPVKAPDDGKGDEKKDDDKPDNKSLCGNGQIDGSEVCDDGNTSSGDGCSADCTAVEDGFECSQSEGKTVCSKKTVCGDGEIEGEEVCDDTNTKDGDGCSADCTTIEENYTCPVPGADCIPKGCGNEIVEEETEICDNGSLNVEYGSGPGECSVSCQDAPYCGDGNIDNLFKEECDSGSEDKSGDYEGCSSECKIVNYCGDGVVQAEHEKCDDGNPDDGDGCSSTCTMEENFVCVTENGKSVCALISCGNGEFDGSETCDDGNRVSGDGCSAICQLEKGYVYVENENGDKVLTRICGDGVRQDLDTGKACSESSKNCEACDDGNLDSGDGCSNVCTVEAGYICPDAGKSCVARSCGDGIIAKGEECDDGFDKEKGVPVSGDGCSERCKIEPGYHCLKPGSPCEAGTCGDGFLDGGETCDEGTSSSNGGCVNCQIQKGWKCEEPGKPCVATTCGDGIVEGLETCEEKSDGCVDCQIQTGYHCDDKGQNCVKGKCGDGFLDIGEACDDGDNDAGDGCSPLCTIEDIFECVEGVCKAICGDGLTIWQAGEECDDGNLLSGDGCSSQCKIEKGYTCTDFTIPNPPKIDIPITYRDFRGWNDGPYPGSGTTDGYLSQELYDKLPAECKQSSGYRMDYFPAPNYAIPDFQTYCVDQYCQNTVYEELDAEGKPVLRPSSDFILNPNFPSGDTTNLGKSYTCQDVFKWWYRDVPGLNIPIHTHLTLTQNANDPDLYEFGSHNFFPILEQGYHDPAMNPRASNSGKFTSEFLTYFKYKGGEKLVFDGDDDAWVFINNRLAVDMGCMHVSYASPIVLDEETAKKLNIFPGGIYSIRMFHAERCSENTTGSIYQVSLRGFVNMGKSTCETRCGDGVVAGTEECDYQTDDLENVEQQHANGCDHCKLAPWCGNGKLEKGEGCEYDESSNSDWCNSDCTIKTCGNGKLDSHEQCDGDAGLSAGQVCLPTCRISGCGDGFVDESIGEECDDGNTSNDDACTTQCKAPYCGDGIVTPSIGEVCDDGGENNDGGYGHCGIGCSYIPPRCGDGVIDTVEGEECDDGTDNNVGGYGRCKADCKLDIHCGDNIVQPEFEQCDEGQNNGKESCTAFCSQVVN